MPFAHNIEDERCRYAEQRSACAARRVRPDAAAAAHAAFRCVEFIMRLSAPTIAAKMPGFHAPLPARSKDECRCSTPDAAHYAASAHHYAQ